MRYRCKPADKKKNVEPFCFSVAKWDYGILFDSVFCINFYSHPIFFTFISYKNFTKLSNTMYLLNVTQKITLVSF